ncbi:MAG: membrane protein insertion efficiency factor YidD [Oscillospiraceae bacterium]|nr:membrane protein insertion efficiency factor YidD [Oscillospiraceae bacterium]
MLKKIFIFPVKLYKRYISPHLGDHCRYWPTCSEYMMQAIEIHGAAKGLLLGTWRLLRCNPWSKGGHDPVPPKGMWTNNNKTR